MLAPGEFSGSDRGHTLKVRDKDGRTVDRAVMVEATDDGGLEVKSGLEPGDVVVLPSFTKETGGANREASLRISVQSKLGRLPDDVRAAVREAVTKGGDAEAKLKAKGIVELPRILKNAGFTDAEIGVVIPDHRMAGQEGSERSGFYSDKTLQISIQSKLDRLPEDLRKVVDGALKSKLDAEPYLLSVGILDFQSILRNAGFTPDEIGVLRRTFTSSRRAVVAEPIRTMSEKVKNLSSEIREELRKAGASFRDREAVLKKSGRFSDEELDVLSQLGKDTRK